MYNKFYYLHLPKTGGRPLKEKLYPDLENHIQIILREGHHGWTKEIDDNTYIMSIMRDPIKLMCSLYTHFIFVYMGKAKNDEILESGLSSHLNIKKVYFKKENFINWLTKYKIYHNFQSKHFLPMFPLEHMIPIAPDKLNIDLLLERVERVNLFFDHESIIGDGIYKIVDKIQEDLGIFIDIRENDLVKFSNKGSSDLYNSLTEEDKSYLSNFFKIDYMIYDKIRGV